MFLILGYVFIAGLLLSLGYLLYALSASQVSAFKFSLIAATTFAGLYAMTPPREKLRLGIDLKGGTILVYEVIQENLPPNFKMDDLISALKHRLDPSGVREIPIRKVGVTRFEIILPEESGEEVEEVKRLLTDVGSLEFRILASRKHDAAVVDRARSAPTA